MRLKKGFLTSFQCQHATLIKTDTDEKGNARF